MPKILLVLLFASTPSVTVADELSETSIPFAEMLVTHMQDFDTKKVAPLLYTEPMIRLGADPAELQEKVSQLDSQLRAAGAQYLVFELHEPTRSFSGIDGDYVLIPYTSVLALGEQKIEQRAFFIGVTNDGGESWRFMDGIATARVPIDVVIPDYAGPALPAVSRRPLE